MTDESVLAAQLQQGGTWAQQREAPGAPDPRPEEVDEQGVTDVSPAIAETDTDYEVDVDPEPTVDAPPFRDEQIRVNENADSA